MLSFLQDDELIEGVADGSGIKARLLGASSKAAPIAEGVPPETVPETAESPSASGPTREGQLYIGDAKVPVMTCQVPISSAATLRDFIGVFPLIRAVLYMSVTSLPPVS